MGDIVPADMHLPQDLPGAAAVAAHSPRGREATVSALPRTGWLGRKRHELVTSFSTSRASRRREESGSHEGSVCRAAITDGPSRFSSFGLYQPLSGKRLPASHNPVTDPYSPNEEKG